MLHVAGALLADFDVGHVPIVQAGMTARQGPRARVCLLGNRVDYCGGGDPGARAGHAFRPRAAGGRARRAVGVAALEQRDQEDDGGQGEEPALHQGRLHVDRLRSVGDCGDVKRPGLRGALDQVLARARPDRRSRSLASVDL